MIEVGDGDYIVGFWFASNARGDDWMGAIIKPKGSKFFKGWWRFRDRVDDKLDHTSIDTKRWTSFFSTDENETEENAIASLNKVQAKVSERYPETDFLHVQGDLSVLMEKASAKSWFNMERMSPEEAKAKGII